MRVGTPLIKDPVIKVRPDLTGCTPWAWTTAFLAATPSTGTVFATGIVALNGRALAAGRGAGQKRNRLVFLVPARDEDWRGGIAVAALDPFRGYPPPHSPSPCRERPRVGRIPCHQARLRRPLPTVDLATTARDEVTFV